MSDDSMKVCSGNFITFLQFAEKMNHQINEYSESAFQMNETEIQFGCYQFNVKVIFSTKMKDLFEFNTAEYRD